MIDRRVIESIRDRVDIAEVVSTVVTLRRKGSSLMGLCPFHDEKSPSFSVVPHKGIYHCFGCGEGGDAFRFLQKTQGVEFYDAVRQLGEKVGIAVEDEAPDPRQKQRLERQATLHDVCEEAALWFQANLLARSEGREALAYLEARALSRKTIEGFRLGFAPESWDGLLSALRAKGINESLALAAGLARPRERGGGAYDLFRGRVIVPIEDGRGRVIAFGGRVLKGTPDAPKYVNSPETDIYKKSRVLYALSRARPHIQRKGRLLVVEGYFDVIALHQAGFGEAVATCGTALTTEHLEAIRRLADTVVLSFDADEAGQRAAVRSMDLFADAGIEPRRLDLADQKDPDEFVRALGAEAFDAALARSEPMVEVVLRTTMARNGSSPQGRERTLEEMARIVRKLPSGARETLIGRLSSALGIDERIIRERIGRSPSGDAVASVPRPARWTGSVELNHILWLLIHHGPLVVESLGDVDPDLVTDRGTVRQAMARLMGGEALSAVVADLDAQDPDVARVLRVAAAREDLYEADKAQGAIRQILARLQLARVEAELARVGREVAACSPEEDTARYLGLCRLRQELQQRRRALKGLASD